MKRTTCRDRRTAGQVLADMVAVVTTLVCRGLSFAGVDEHRTLRLLPSPTVLLLVLLAG